MNISPLVKVEHDANILRVTSQGNMRQLSFPYPISNVLKCGECLIVMVDPPIGKILNENVYGVSYAGEKLWQVETTTRVSAESPYTGMSFKDNILSLFSWDGITVIVDPATGKVLKKWLSK